MDKKKFGLYIKECRTNKNYTQQELANILYVDVTTISKWERGVTYPDITMIPDICNALDITEHELIQASRDTEYRKIKKEAKTFINIKKSIFWTFNICYLVAIIATFIVNLAVNHTLSWFFIVLAAILSAYSFCPTFTFIFKKHKLLVFLLTSFCSLSILFLTLSIYTSNYWFLIATVGLLIGYFVLFFPSIFRNILYSLPDEKRNNKKRYFYLIYLSSILILLCLLYLVIYMYNSFNILLALLISLPIFAFLLLLCVLYVLHVSKIVYKIILIVFGVILISSTIFSIASELYLKTTKYTSNLQITENYNSVKLEIDDAEVILVPSNTKTSNMKYISSKLVSFDYEVINGELIIKQIDNRKIYQKLFNFTDYTIVVYLSIKDLDMLVVNNKTGDITVNEGLTFENINIQATTADIEYYGSVKEDLNIKTTTGDIEIQNVSCNNLDVKCTTGDIDLFNMYINETVFVETTTGEVELDSVICNKLNIKVSTGDIDLDKVKVTSELTIKGTTSDVSFDQLEAGGIYINLSTGDVEGRLSKKMTFNISVKTGNVNVPDSNSGGICKIELTTGSVKISYNK